MVDILVSNYNSGPAIELCIESVRRYTPEGAYRLVVFHDRCRHGIDSRYLHLVRDKGWIELHESEKQIGHGAVLNRLINDICRTERAVVLDCDIQILRPGWLQEGLSLLAPDVLGICDERSLPGITDEGYFPGFYQAWFLFLNMAAYRDMGGVDWRFTYEDATRWPYPTLYAGLGGVPKSPRFRENRSCEDPGSRLWMRAKYFNPRGYRMLPVPLTLREKYRHFGHMAFFSDLPDDHDDYTRAHKRGRMSMIEAELRYLRGERG